MQDGAQGIPTKYGGINFRSRTEAKWAKFFDLMRWSWEYEPIDLKGYIPDFILSFPRAPLLVEVKCEFTLASLGKHTEKIINSGWDQEILIVGARLFDAENFDALSLGILCEREEWGPDWSTCTVGKCENEVGGAHWGLSHDQLSYTCRVCGVNVGNPVTANEHVVLSKWREACNAVQWRGRP